MPSYFLNVVAFALLPMGAALVGAIIAAFRPPRAIYRSFIQHLAAGVVFSVVAVELLPSIIHQRGALVEVFVGFAFGVIVMLAMRSLSHKLEKQGNENPLGLLVGVGIDISLDGFLISVSFAAGAKEGQLLTLALTLEFLSLGLAVATALGKNEKNRQKVILTAGLLFLLIVVSAGLGAVLIPLISASLLEVLLSFGLAALLYLVTEELLVEAHEEPETPAASGMFFLGFLIFLLLGMAE
jgi:zinc transporter, ZIP family